MRSVEIAGTKKAPKNRLYWLDGASRSEVEKSLADRRPSRLRDQGPRRVLVLTSALVMAALVFTIFISKGRVNLVHPCLAAQKLGLRL